MILTVGYRVAYAALPLIWHILDNGIPRTIPLADESRKGSPNVYLQVMKVLQTRYEGTDTALEHVGKLMKGIALDAVLCSPSCLSHEPGASSICQIQSKQLTAKSNTAQDNSWRESLIYRPHSYLRVIHTLDFFLSHGQFPSTNDFSRTLQLLQSRTSLPLYETLRTTGTFLSPGEYDYNQNTIQQRPAAEIHRSASDASIDVSHQPQKGLDGFIGHLVKDANSSSELELFPEVSPPSLTDQQAIYSEIFQFNDFLTDSDHLFSTAVEMLG